MRRSTAGVCALVLSLALALPAAALAQPAGTKDAAQAQAAKGAPALNDMLAQPLPTSLPDADYVKRVEMIPMRDGVKLYTVIVTPKGAHDAPIILTRTPYNAAKRAARTENSPSMLSTLPLSDEPFVKLGWIRVYQDVRGKYGSEGDYVMTRPVVGPLNPTKVDHVTDAYDTIDWLVKHVPESNGKVGMIGSSYEGFTVVMALLNPHPALKAAVPESPMVDGWMGDDWFHYGAFRQPNFDYVASQTSKRGAGDPVPRDAFDDYDGFLRAGSAGDYARAHHLDLYGWNRKMMQHPAYDAFWSGQALDAAVAAHPTDIPTVWEQGLWDQEDMWGANHSYAALKAAGKGATNWLVMGPWFHSQINREGYNLGVFRWEGDTALQFRKDVVTPFFAHYLAGGPDPALPHALVYNTGENHWDRLADWPRACEAGCASGLKPLYLQAGFGLGFDKPAQAGGDAYVSDPAKPVPYLPRPVRFSDSDAWRTWLVRDQRFVDGRPDVLTYITAPLTAPLKMAGAPVADLTIATTGTDGDFVVKLIDVWPDVVASQPELGGYEQPIATDIFRGRYRESPSAPKAFAPNTPTTVKFTLPNADHVFQPGHRVMVQVQSTLFPLYDRNPQTFVPNIFDAKPADYRAATVTVERGGPKPSAVWLPVVP
jgi:putative CocE/NonD family hydrolase